MSSMNDELRSRLERQTQANVDAGMNPGDARIAAHRRFGWTGSVKGESRERFGGRWVENLAQDLRFGARQLVKNPGFAAVAVLTLALGVGATTAIFSVVYGVVISPYPYANPGGIWVPGVRSAQTTQTMRSYRLAEYMEMSKLPVFSQAMATRPGSMLLTGEFSPETMRAVQVSGSTFQFLGDPVALGRAITPSDISPGGVPEPVTVLSFKLWQRLFGGNTNVLGRTLRLDDQLYTIIGVMPSRFGWWTDNGLWVPMGLDTRDERGVFPLARLKPGIKAKAAEQQLQALQQELAKVNPSGFPKEQFTSLLTNYLNLTVASGEMESSLWLLFGAVGFLLLIACANVANLQLARAASRGREMAVRLAVGAGRGHLLRQLLTESVLISLLGGLLGLVFACWITDLMVRLMPGFFVPSEARIEINGHALIFCLVVSVLTGIVFGLAPALHSARANLSDALKEDSRGSVAAGGGKTRSLLVVVEVALAVVLLAVAGLTIRSFLALQTVKLGFRPERVMTAELPLSPKRYATLEQRNRFARELLERVVNLPGVAAATVGNGGLPFGGPDTAYSIDGVAAPESRRVTMFLVGEGYLRTLGVPLLRGRMLTPQEVDDARPVAVINEQAAKLWPAGEDPVGRQIHLDLLEQLAAAGPGGARGALAHTNMSPLVTIVGVAGNTRNDDLRRDAQPAVLIPYTMVAPTQRTLAIRGSVDPSTMMNALRAQVREIDKEQPVSGPTTIDEILGFAMAQPRFISAVFTLFAGLGLALAMAGIYSVLSYLVSQRTREIGVRIALGAGRADVLRLVFRLGGRLVGVGMVVGIVASVGVTRLAGSQMSLFQVGSSDPVSLLGVAFLLGLVAAAACFIPARRAARVDPMVALRMD